MRQLITGGYRRARVHESGPFQRRAVGVDRVVNTPRLAARVGRIDLAILIAKSAQTVPELVSYRVPGNAERQNCETSSSATTEARVVQQDQHQVMVRHPCGERIVDARRGIRAPFQPAM